MNPKEQVWKTLRSRDFRNEAFATLDKVVDRLCGDHHVNDKEGTAKHYWPQMDFGNCAIMILD